MSELKPITHKEFNAFIEGKGFKNRKEYTLKDLKAKFGFKPLIDRRKLVISEGDMKPTMFDSMKKATKAIGVGEKAIMYTKEKNRDSFKRTDSDGCTNVFHKVVLIWTQVKCHTVCLKVKLFLWNWEC